MNIIWEVDLWILVRFAKVLEWGKDYLSFRQRYVELFFYGVYAVLYSRMIIRDFASSHYFWFWRICLFWMLFYFLHRILRSSKRRVSCLIEEIPLRLFFLVLVIGPDFPANFFGFVLLYITALPYSNGKSGRKRKMALAKLKELFGTSWAVRPLPLPH